MRKTGNKCLEDGCDFLTQNRTGKCKLHRTFVCKDCSRVVASRSHSDGNRCGNCASSYRRITRNASQMLV